MIYKMHQRVFESLETASLEIAIEIKYYVFNLFILQPKFEK